MLMFRLWHPFFLWFRLFEEEKTHFRNKYFEYSSGFN